MAKYPTINNIRGLADFATVYQWTVEILNADMGTANGFNTLAYPDGEQLNWRCESHEIPNASNNPVAVQIRGHRVFQPGIQEYSNTINLVFVETVDNLVTNFLRSWREACWQTEVGYQFPKGSGKVPAGAGTDSAIRLIRLNRQLEEIWEYQLYGCWLQSYNQGTLDGSSSEAFKPTMTIQYDYYDDGKPGTLNLPTRPS